jgi:hypothetical protein
MQEFRSALFVASPLGPDEAFAISKVVRPVPVDAFGQPRAIALSPDPLADRAPGVADLQVAVKMGFVDVKQDDLFVNHLIVHAQEPLHERGSLLRVAFAEELLALLPTQSRGPQHLLKRRARHHTLERFAHPLPQFFQRPTASGQVVCFGLRGDRLEDLLRLGRRKKGVMPPVRR